MATNNATNTSNPITVAQGGTGDASLTAYAVLCGGTTSTGNVQSIASVGTSGQVLTSNGAGALPTFQTSTGSGTVNNGTINQLAYYAASGTAVSGLATANKGVLSTSSTGVPSIDTTNFAVQSTGLQLKGNNTNTAPPAGFLGEQISSSASAVSLTSTTPANITSISLTAGIWDISTICFFSGTLTAAQSGPSTTSATLPATGGIDYSQVNFASTGVTLNVGQVRATLSTNTTYYLVSVGFGSGLAANGRITATRVG